LSRAKDEIAFKSSSPNLDAYAMNNLKDEEGKSETNGQIHPSYTYQLDHVMELRK